MARVFGVIDPGHPYISHIYSGGDWLIGGEVQLLDRIRYKRGGGVVRWEPCVAKYFVICGLELTDFVNKFTSHVEMRISSKCTALMGRFERWSPEIREIGNRWIGV